jgi:Bardet-Biedl syndrome 4 protein
MYQIKQEYQTAIDVYAEGLDFSPDNSEIMTTIGLLYIRTGDNIQAFDYLGKSLDHDPRNPKTILATGSII